MGTDRYSDDHKIIIGKGDGDLTIEAATFILDVSSYSVDTENFSLVTNDTYELNTDILNISFDQANFYGNVLDIGTNNVLIDADNMIILESTSTDINSDDQISVSANNLISLDAQQVNIISQGTEIQAYDLSIYLSTGMILNADNQVNIDSPLINVDSTTVNIDSIVNISGLNESGPVVKITNTGRLAGVNNYSTDIMELIFDPSDGGIVDEFNNWILFKKGSDTKGSIEGYQSTIAGPPSYTNKVFSPFAASIGSADSDYLGAGLYNYLGAGPAIFGTTASSWDGYVVYKSGNQDYGEWIEIGNFEEWGIDKVSINTDNQVIGFEEGTLVFVRDSRFWRYGPGTPMIVTNRPIVVGNVNYKEPFKFGEILSFIGQVPVIVMGPVKDGDLLIPKHGENYCISIDKEKITFSQYKECIGTAWSILEEDRLGFVNCAIRIK
jgi:hypothetical protein